MNYKRILSAVVSCAAMLTATAQTALFKQF